MYKWRKWVGQKIGWSGDYKVARLSDGSCLTNIWHDWEPSTHDRESDEYAPSRTYKPRVHPQTAFRVLIIILTCLWFPRLTTTLKVSGNSVSSRLIKTSLTSISHSTILQFLLLFHLVISSPITMRISVFIRSVIFSFLSEL